MDAHNKHRRKEDLLYIIRHWFYEGLEATTILIFCVCKCSDLKLYHRLFNMMPKKDTIAWNAKNYCELNARNSREALLHFKEMVNLGVKPNYNIFIGILSSCSHLRLVDKSLFIFLSINKYHKTEPSVEHWLKLNVFEVM